jgi:hypothetical protein
MTDFVLPSNADIEAIDKSGYTLSSDDAGLVVDYQAAVIKTLIDQMDADETVHIRSTFQSTGKTEKFIVNDCTTIPTIVTTDAWGDAVLDTSTFFTMSGNHDKVFKHILPNASAGKNDDDETISITTTLPGDSSESTLDLTSDPSAMNSAQMARLNFKSTYDLSEIKNHADTALGTDSDELGADLILYFPNVINVGVPDAWMKDYILNLMCAGFNELAVNGTLVVMNAMYSKVNTSVWTMLSAQDSVGRTYETSQINGTDVGVDVICIKRLS